NANDDPIIRGKVFDARERPVARGSITRVAEGAHVYFREAASARPFQDRVGEGRELGTARGNQNEKLGHCRKIVFRWERETVPGRFGCVRGAPIQSDMGTPA